MCVTDTSCSYPSPFNNPGDREGMSALMEGIMQQTQLSTAPRGKVVL